jgi:hypothetical protein
MRMHIYYDISDNRFCIRALWGSNQGQAGQRTNKDHAAQKAAYYYFLAVIRYLMQFAVYGCG